MHYLVCRVGERTCALPLQHVREVMRPLAIESVRPAPEYLLGVSIIRGESVPVLDAAALLQAPAGPPTRLVLLRVGERRVAVAVSAVLGTRVVDPAELGALPPLLRGSGELARGLAVLDGALLTVLESARLIELAPPQRAEAGAP